LSRDKAQVFCARQWSASIMRELNEIETREVDGGDLVLTDFDEPVVAFDDPEYGYPKDFGRYSFPVDPVDRR
jgi:hypothetical protein